MVAAASTCKGTGAVGAGTAGSAAVSPPGTSGWLVATLALVVGRMAMPFCAGTALYLEICFPTNGLSSPFRYLN